MDGPLLPFRPSARQSPPAPPPAYAELAVTSNFSFLRGGSHPAELVSQAVALGLSGLGLCDRNSFAGVVRGLTALRLLAGDPATAPALAGFRYVVGTRLCFADGTPDIIAYPTDRDAYGRLCTLLTKGNLRAAKGLCTLHFSDLAEALEGQLLIVQVDERAWDRGESTLAELARMARGNVWLGASCTYKGKDRARLARLADLAGRCGVPLIAINDVLYHAPERQRLQDVLTCIREHVTIFKAGRRLEQNAERHLKPPLEMARLFREHPEALLETGRLVSRIGFSLEQLQYSYPEETVGNGETAQQTLVRLTWEGAKRRYPRGIPFKVRRGVLGELRLIAEKRYAAYFLTVHDLVRFARDERGILCQGRGSAANSMVCFCLGITEVDPMVGNLVFGRFLSTERDEPPDIDVDFEHERREEAMQYLYGKYGRHRAGLTATVVTYRAKGAVREVAKVFGLSTDMVDAMNQLSWGWHARALDPERVRELGLDPADPILAMALELANELMGFPRHLSQHVGGFVLTRDQLDQYVPISHAAMEGRTVIEWDKDDIDALRILKVDVLALGMLSCIRRAFELMHVHYGEDLTLAGLLEEEREDKFRPEGEKKSARVYAMTHRADTIGVFQIESRAQMTMLPRLRPREFYDFVIEVAIVRPGPIQGGMVHPYLQRRIEGAPITYPSEKLRAVLERTLGIPLFQEQAMQIAVVGAGFSPGEADQLRRAMATWRRNGRINTFRERFIAGMEKNSFDRDFAERCFRQIEGFGEYGFPESHAASFALLVYVSCWLKCHYPDVFCCALLNSQPMGFYAPAQIVRDAIEHGVEVHAVDVNLSDAECVLEAGRPAAPHVWPRHADQQGDIRSTHGVRLGLNFVKGLREADINLIVARRGRGYDSVRDLWLRTGLAPASLERLAEADAFGSLGLGRRDALWAVGGLRGTDGAETLPLFAQAGAPSSAEEPDRDLPPMPPGEEVVHDYRSLSLSLKGHPMAFLRPMLSRRGTLRAADLATAPLNREVEIAGLVLVRQRPGTASGVIFATLEDETGSANIIVWPKLFETNRRVVLGARLMAVRGRLQREGLVIHVVGRTFADLTPHLLELADGHTIGDASMARADEGRSGPPAGRDAERTKREELARRIARASMPGGRNFH
ncbi:DNA polymerase III subunit alpha [Arsenicitalea aurantiaca]|uniref:Error-prone DNA polymerase n=1 Tax=Arsenicitalea aurantiaca TaxID=1783274 RepID=A0A433X5N4_9HYPH|nr:error-prone DNA polymerase [Arsenicitalea aurantiaca]RUT29357.1 DNA polymerase III subunit alpha [Arsenicitalea aurantiaca]